MRVSRSAIRTAAKASLILILSISTQACVTTESHLTVRSSYGGIAQKLAKIQPAVPTCPPGTQLQMRVRTDTEGWVDTDSRRIRPNDVGSMYTIERDYRCRPSRQTTGRSPY